MSGILALLAAEREERLTGAEPMKTELLLAQAGVPIRDIARIIGKNYQAVQKVVWRARPVNAGRASDKESTNA